MSALALIIELVEVAALIVLLIYLIRLIRDQDDSEPRTALVDRNLAELAEFHQLMIGSPDITRIWQDGRADRRLNDIDDERFSLLAGDYLSILANQYQRAAAAEDTPLAEAAASKLVDNLQINPGLVSIWEEIADSVAPDKLRSIVVSAMAPQESQTGELPAGSPPEADPVEQPQQVTVSIDEPDGASISPEPADLQSAEPPQSTELKPQAGLVTNSAETAGEDTSADTATPAPSGSAMAQASEPSDTESTNTGPDTALPTDEKDATGGTATADIAQQAEPRTDAEADKNKIDNTVAKAS